MSLIWALAALAYAHTSLACNSLVYKDPCNGNVVSASSFSQTFDLAVGLMVMSPGAATPALEVAPGVKGVLNGEVKAKYGWACTGHDFFAEVFCNQGMNEKGLAVSFQANNENATISQYNASDPRPAINFWDLSNAILSGYETVAQVKADYSKYQIVYNPETFPFGSSPDDPPIWLVIYDATGAAAVIQFKVGYGEIVDNPVGVAANDPGFIEDQTAQYLAHAQKLGLTVDPVTRLITGPITTDPKTKISFLGAMGTFRDAFSIPGGYDGDARFMRLAMLKSFAALQGCGPDPKISATSPSALEKGYPATLPSLMVADMIIRSVSLTQGTTDFGTIAWKGDPAEPFTNGYQQEATYTWNLRDLTNKVLFIRTANNWAWRRLDLGKAKWRKSKALRWEPLHGVPKNPGFVEWTKQMVKTKELKAPKE
ncbi:MAG: nucleophile aminohydrolase [Monoraphidium minutum]|nr:MAG: nucleophile aminohydrolase [Monoraphidium minutum]